MIAIYRDIIGYYRGDPERQEQEFQELMREIKQVLMPP
jgi:hypothetical protein